MGIDEQQKVAVKALLTASRSFLKGKNAAYSKFRDANKTTRDTLHAKSPA